MAHDLHAILRLARGRKEQPTAIVLDARTLQSSIESSPRAGYDGNKRRKGSKVHLAMDVPGHLLALHVTPANKQERAQVGELATQAQEVTGENVTLAWVDQGYTGEEPAAAAQAHGIRLEVVKPTEAKKGFVLLPRRWVVERSFAWSAGSPGTMKGSQPPWQDSISSLSPASSSPRCLQLRLRESSEHALEPLNGLTHELLTSSLERSFE